MPTASPRQPVLYIPHGGGPWPFVDGIGQPGTWDRLRAYLEGLGQNLPERPRALLVVSAHWEAEVPTVLTSARPPMLYDYYGFPDAAYQVTWPAPGAPDVAARAKALLGAAGIAAEDDADRGFDHGTFVPLKLAFPAADVPTTQLSLVKGLDPAQHVAIGRALAPLREQGVLIVGSGMSFHNMNAFRGSGGRQDDARAFDTWLQEAVTRDRPAREAALAAWAQAPGGRASHPREEHLLPLMVIAGAAGDDRGDVPYTDTLLGHTVSAVHFG